MGCMSAFTLKSSFVNVLSCFQGNEARLYEYIVRHFLACCSEDARGQETTVEIEINGELFTASGLMIIARNYLDVYPYEKWNAKVFASFSFCRIFFLFCFVGALFLFQNF